jgi:hypothetical protein
VVAQQSQIGHRKSVPDQRDGEEQDGCNFAHGANLTETHGGVDANGRTTPGLERNACCSSYRNTQSPRYSS